MLDGPNPHGVLVSDGIQNGMTGNWLLMGVTGNDIGHLSLATLTLDTPVAVTGTTISMNANLLSAGGQDGGILISGWTAGGRATGTAIFQAVIGVGGAWGQRDLNAVTTLDTAPDPKDDNNIWGGSNQNNVFLTFNLGDNASGYTMTGNIAGTTTPFSVAGGYFTDPDALSLSVIEFQALGSKAGLGLDDLFVGVPAAIPAKLQADSPQQFTNNGAPETLLVPFANVGTTTALNITGVTLTGGDTDFFTAPTVWTPDVAFDGGTGTISLPFDPTQIGGGPGFYTIDLEVASNGAGTPQTITVDVEVIDPVAAVTPSALDFGTDTATFTMDVNIANTGGSETLTIHSVTVVDDPDGVFSVGAPPAPLTPGENANVTVTYTPGAATGYFTGTLEIDTDSAAPTQSFFTVPLSARQTGAAVTSFTADFEGSAAETAGTTIPEAGWLTTPANLALGSTGGGWSGLSTTVIAPSTQVTGLGVSSGTATGMTGNWLLFGNVGNTQPLGDTDNAHTYASIELDAPMPLVDGTSLSLDMNLLVAGGQPGELRITGRDASGTALFQIIGGNGGAVQRDLATSSDEVGTVDEKIDNAWPGNNTVATVDLALDAADYTVTADGGTTMITGTYLAAGDLASIEFHALDALDDPDTTIVVEYGSDLTGWTTAENDVDGVTITEDTDGGGTNIDLVTVAIPRALATGGKLFVRLNVTVVP